MVVAHGVLDTVMFAVNGRSHDVDAIISGDKVMSWRRENITPIRLLSLTSVCPSAIFCFRIHYDGGQIFFSHGKE